MLSWLFHIIFILLFIVVYLHIYVHFRVTSENELTEIDDICRKNITDTIYHKKPFIFDGISHPLKLDDAVKNSNKGYNTYNLIYESIPLLEPNVRFFPSRMAYQFLKKERSAKVETNLECRNFYLVNSGKVKIICIHPKYKEYFINNNIDFIKKSEHMIHLELEKNQILFVPNYWYVYMESMDKNTIVEKIQYKTILNHFNFICNNLLKKYL